MKDQILKIAKVKSEKEFYKKYPTEEAFMAKHGKAFKKAAMGNSMVNDQLHQLTDYGNPPIAQGGIQIGGPSVPDAVNLTGSTSNAWNTGISTAVAQPTGFNGNTNLFSALNSVGLTYKNNCFYHKYYATPFSNGSTNFNFASVR